MRPGTRKETLRNAKVVSGWDLFSCIAANLNGTQSVPKKKLETEGCGCNDLTFCAPEAAIGIEAAGDVLTVKQVVHMQRHVGTRHADARQIVTY